MSALLVVGLLLVVLMLAVAVRALCACGEVTFGIVLRVVLLVGALGFALGRYWRDLNG